MICKGCGKEISNDSVFCTFCGYKYDSAGNVPQGQANAPVFQVPPGKAQGQQWGQSPSGQVPGQANQMPQGQQWGQSSSGQVPGQVNQMPQGQQWGQSPTGQAPGQMNQMPQGQQWGQSPAGQAPGQVNQMPQGQQWGQNPMGQLPPQGPYGSMQGYSGVPSGPKKNKFLLPIIIVSVLLVLAIVLAFAFPKIKDAFSNSSDKNSSEDDDNDNSGSDKNDKDRKDTTTTPSPTPTEIPESPDTPITPDTPVTPVYNPYYSYLELSDVISLDSDSRFNYYNYASESGVATYQFYFNDLTATLDDFIDALDSYSYTLQTDHGFYYEQELSEEEYASTGEAILYLTRDDTCLSIVPSFDDNYAYVNIFSLSEQGGLNEGGEVSTYYYYDDYIYGREELAFDSYTDMSIENGVIYNLKELYSNDMGDGSMEVEVNMDLGGYYYDLYLSNNDFMILPMDSDGNIIADASPVYYIRDTSGSDMTIPLPLNADAYENYSLFFYVPDNTASFRLYATNTYDGTPAGSLYYIEYDMN